jgi:hypothetical protein
MIIRSLVAASVFVLGSSTSLAQSEGASAAAPAAQGPASSTEALRGELNALLASMAARALDADFDGYLKHIDPADDRFVNEQKYWAKDLLRVPAAELVYELGEEIKTPAEGVAEARLTVKWAMKKPDGTKAKARDVNFDARFSKRDGNWTYSGEAWLRHEAPGVIVFYWPGFEDLAKGVAEVFPSIRAAVEPGFNLVVPRAQEIKLFASMKHLQHSICLSYTDGLGGWNEPGEPIKQLAHKGQTGESSKVVLAHEFGHACTFEMGPTSNEMPWWALEGVAELSAEVFSNSRESNDRAVRKMAREGKIPNWDDLARFNEVSGENYGKVYTLGHHMLGFISDRFERKGRVAWLHAMSNGKSLDEATRSALGMSFAELDAEWRAEIAKPLPEKEGKPEGSEADKPAGDAKPAPKGDAAPQK